MGAKNDNGGGLSLATLAIASASSLAAAIVVHHFWQAGAFVGAAVTPVIVALVSEGLRKPVDVVKAKTTVNPPPVVPQPGGREDRFGIWEDRQRPVGGRRRLHVGLAIATGLVAFVIAGFFLTGAELVFGGASGSDKFRVLPGKQEKKRSDRDSQPATTQPSEEEQAPQETVPEEEAPQETVPEETVPDETVPVPPEQTAPAPPEQTVPAP
jgi:hypothetical protein